MLSTLLQKLENILENYNQKFDSNQIKSLAEILDIYSDGILPISVVRRELRMSMEQTQDLMIYLETKGILKSMFRVYCPSKSECVREELYDDIRNVPKKHCDKCDENCLYIENISVVFKVVS